MTCSNLKTNVVVQPANATFNAALLTTPTYNCYGSVCDSAGNSSAASGASSSAVAGSQNRIVVVQLFYNWDTVASLFGLNGIAMTTRSGVLSMTATSVVTAEAYSCSSSQTSC